MAKGRRRGFWTASALLAVAALATGAEAEQFLFLCSVDNVKPFDLTVDVDARRATRSDRGGEYDLVQISAVWLVADKQPRTSLAVEMIERVVAVNRETEGGSWLRTTIRQSGPVADKVAGHCWEQP